MTPDRKTLAAIRKQLKDPDLAVALQGAEAAAAYPALLAQLCAGIAAPAGALASVTIDPAAELRRRVRAAHRSQVAARLLLHLDGPTMADLSLSGPQPVALLAKMAELRRLSLATCPLDDLAWLRDLTKLESLVLYRCGTPDLSPIAALPALTTLSIYPEPPDLDAFERPGLTVVRTPPLRPARIVNGGQICSTIDLSKDQAAQQAIVDAGFDPTDALWRMHEARWPIVIRALDDRIKNRPLVHQLNVAKVCDTANHTIVRVAVDDNRHLLGYGDDVVDFFIALIKSGVEVL